MLSFAALRSLRLNIQPGEGSSCETIQDTFLTMRIPLPSLFVPALGPPAGSIKNLVTFGDSFSDVNSYSNGSPLLWPQYAAAYGNFSLHPYAKNSAVCSEKLTPRSTRGPGILEDELPAYFNDTTSGLYLDPDSTIYTLWIGTNDLGPEGLLVGLNPPNTTIVDVSRCPLDWIKAIYDVGGRNFIIQNVGHYPF